MVRQSEPFQAPIQGQLTPKRVTYQTTLMNLVCIYISRVYIQCLNSIYFYHNNNIYIYITCVYTMAQLYVYVSQ